MVANFCSGMNQWTLVKVKEGVLLEEFSGNLSHGLAGFITAGCAAGWNAEELYWVSEATMNGEKDLDTIAMGSSLEDANPEFKTSDPLC